jgi:hypothetical protein
MANASRRACLTAAIAACVVLISGCRTPAPPPASQINDDWVGLFLAVTKSFGTRTYYIGSDNKWSYFQTNFEESLFTPTYRKVHTSSMRLRRTFLVQQGAPYRVELSDFACDKNSCRPL